MCFVGVCALSALNEQSLENAIKAFGNGHPVVARIMDQGGELMLSNKDFEEAEARFSQARMVGMRRRFIEIDSIIVCVCVFSSHPFWTSSSLDVPAGVTQEEGHTGFLIHLPSAVRALIFVARRIQPFLSLVDREVEFCVLTN